METTLVDCAVYLVGQDNINLTLVDRADYPVHSNSQMPSIVAGFSVAGGHYDEAEQINPLDIRRQPGIGAKIRKKEKRASLTRAKIFVDVLNS